MPILQHLTLASIHSDVRLWGLLMLGASVSCADPQWFLTASSAVCWPLRSSVAPHSFFCSVLPSAVLRASSAVCYSLRSSQLLLQCAALWDPHSFFFSVLLFAVPTAFSAVCCPLAVSGHAVKWEDTLIECAAVSGLPDHNHTEQLRCALSLQCPVLRLRQKRDVCSAQPRW